MQILYNLIHRPGSCVNTYQLAPPSTVEVRDLACFANNTVFMQPMLSH